MQVYTIVYFCFFFTTDFCLTCCERMATDSALEKGMNCNVPTQLLVFGYMRSIAILTHNISDIISFMIIGYYFHNDILELQNNKRIQKVLSKQICPIFAPIIETVKLSMYLTKINRQKKELNNRILLLTNKALYSFKSKQHNWGKRICIEDIEYVLILSEHNSLIIHTTSDNDFFDYHFFNYKSFYNEHIASILTILYQNITNKSLPIYIDEKPKSFPTRKQQLSQYKDLVDQTKRLDDEINYSFHPKLDDFQFMTLIGVTYNGKIIKLKNKSNNEIFTAKVIRKQSLSQNDNGVTMNINISHRFLPHLSFVFETEEKIYYLYKYDHSQYNRLYYYLQNGERLSESQAIFYISVITSVLGYLHSMNIIYKNVKTENILIDKNGNIYLNLMNEMYGVCSEYLAPEMIQYIPNLQNFEYNKSIDWWCLGILLYELILGFTPFYERFSSLDKLYLRIKEKEVEFHSEYINMSHWTKDLITKLLQKQSNKRLGSGSQDVVEIQNHNFFKNVDFDKLVKGEINPPYKPKIDDNKPSVGCGFTFKPPNKLKDSGLIISDNDDKKEEDVEGKTRLEMEIKVKVYSQVLVNMKSENKKDID
eukprot:300670_1